MISTAQYLGRQYNRAHYNCAHFVCDVWRDATGKDISPILTGCLAGKGETKLSLSQARAFREIKKPSEFCMVLFQGRNVDPHVGVMLRGKVLHIGPRGVEYQPLDIVSMGFDKVRFATC